jgi:hypothetical protein
MKRETPYSRLLDKIKEFCYHDIKHAKTVFMERYNANAWGGMYHRIQAAERLGYEVVLKNNDGAIEVWYREKPNIPFSWTI